MSLPQQRHILCDLDLSQFASDASAPSRKRPMPTSPIKLSPTKRRILQDEGFKFRTYRAMPYPQPGLKDLSDVRSDKVIEEPASQNASSPHYCGFSIFRDSCSTLKASAQSRESDGEVDTDEKENSRPNPPCTKFLSPLPLPSSSLVDPALFSPPKLVFPPPQPLELGDVFIGSKPSSQDKHRTVYQTMAADEADSEMI